MRWTRRYLPKCCRTVLKADTYACMQLLEQIIMQGRDLGQFVSDFVWYLRNLLLVKTTDDEAKAEDIIDVSADNLEQLKKTVNRLMSIHLCAISACCRSWLMS